VLEGVGARVTPYTEVVYRVPGVKIVHDFTGSPLGGTGLTATLAPSRALNAVRHVPLARHPILHFQNHLADFLYVMEEICPNLNMFIDRAELNVELLISRTPSDV